MSSKPPRAQTQPQVPEQLIGNVLEDDQNENAFLRQLRSKMSPKSANGRQPLAWKLQEAPSSNYGSSPKNGVSLFHSNGVTPSSQRQQFWGATPRTSGAAVKPQTPASSRGSGTATNNSGTPPGSAAGRSTWAQMAAGREPALKPDTPSNMNARKHLAMEAARPRSAPPKLTETPTKEPIHREDTPSLYIGGEKIAPDDYRLSPTYYAYYYSQRPLDPRLPKPLFDWSAWTSPQGTNSTFKPFHLPGRGAKNGSGNGVNGGLKFETPTKAKVSRPDQYQVPSPVRGPPSHPRLEARPTYVYGRHSRWKRFDNLQQASRETNITYSDIQGILNQLLASGGSTNHNGWELRLSGSRAGEHGIDMRGQGQNYQDPAVQNYGISAQQYNGERVQQGVPPIQVDSGFRQPGEQQQLHNRMAHLQIHSQGSPTHSPSQGPFGNHGMNRSQYPPPALGYGGYSPVGVAPYSPSPMMAMMGYGTKDGEEVNHNVPQLAAQYSPITTPVVAASLPPPLGLTAQYSPVGPTILTAQYSPQAGPMTMLPPAMAPQYQQTPGQMHQQQPAYGGRAPAQNYGGGNTQRGGGGGRRNQREAPSQNGGGERSQLLAELRAQNMNRQPTLMDVVNQQLVTELSMDQNGSRFIQQRLEHATPQEKDAVFEQILPETIRLAMHPFQNYLVQVFLNPEISRRSHFDRLSKVLAADARRVSLHKHGCRVIQKALEHGQGDRQLRMLGELKDHVLELVRDQNGNHVIQKVIEKLPAERVEFVAHAFRGRAGELSAHPYGCRVIQRLMERLRPPVRVPLLEEILQHTVELCLDQYGNYVIQHILKNAPKEWQGKVAGAIRGHVKAFGMHKFASNVVEKCFQIAGDKEKEMLLQEIMGKGSESPLTELVRDQYGNYVIQKILASVSGSQRSRLIRRITAMVPNIRKIAYGKHIISKIEKLTGKSYSDTAPTQGKGGRKKARGQRGGKGR